MEGCGTVLAHPRYLQVGCDALLLPDVCEGGGGHLHQGIPLWRGAIKDQRASAII